MKSEHYMRTALIIGQIFILICTVKALNPPFISRVGEGGYMYIIRDYNPALIFLIIGVFFTAIGMALLASLDKQYYEVYMDERRKGHV